MGEDRPGDARMFGGEGDRGDVHASAVLQPSRQALLPNRMSD